MPLLKEMRGPVMRIVTLTSASPQLFSSSAFTINAAGVKKTPLSPRQPVPSPSNPLQSPSRPFTTTPHHSRTMSPLAPGHHSFSPPSAPDFTFHYRSVGTGPPLLAHSVGWGPSSSYLTHYLYPLHAHFTVLYFEPRGNGLSTCPADADMASETMAHDIEHLRAHLGLDKFPVMLGHSNGGHVALIYAELYPERVEKLVLVAPQVLGKKDGGHMARVMAERKESQVYGKSLEAIVAVMTVPPETDEGLAEGLKGILPYYFSEEGLEKKGGLVEEFGKALEGEGVPPRARAFRMQGRADMERPFDNIGRAGEVKAKLLVVVGRGDAVCDPKRAEELRDGVEGAELVVLECGHLPFAEKKEEFWGAVGGFLGF